jgi:hypothetical protein
MRKTKQAIKLESHLSRQITIVFWRTAASERIILALAERSKSWRNAAEMSGIVTAAFTRSPSRALAPSGGINDLKERTLRGGLATDYPGWNGLDRGWRRLLGSGRRDAYVIRHPDRRRLADGEMDSRQTMVERRNRQHATFRRYDYLEQASSPIPPWPACGIPPSSEGLTRGASGGP